jgi:hypothetical protein
VIPGNSFECIKAHWNLDMHAMCADEGMAVVAILEVVL